MNINRDNCVPEWAVWLASMRTTFLRDLLRGAERDKAEAIKAELIRRGVAQ